LLFFTATAPGSAKVYIVLNPKEHEAHQERWGYWCRAMLMYWVNALDMGYAHHASHVIVSQTCHSERSEESRM
jgi:hypothetical protein